MIMAGDITTAPTILPARIPERHPRAHRPSRALDRLRSTFKWLANLLMLLAVLAFLGFAVGPRLFNYRTQVMLTGSMAPEIKPGDVAVTRPIPLSALAVGDVITYAIPIADHRVVSHRIVSIARNPDRTFTVQTKGDALAIKDPWTAQFQDTRVWRVEAVIPKVGTAIRALRQPVVSEVMRFAAPGMLAFIALVAIWRRPAHPKGLPAQSASAIPFPRSPAQPVPSLTAPPIPRQETRPVPQPTTQPSPQPAARHAAKGAPPRTSKTPPAPADDAVATAVANVLGHAPVPSRTAVLELTGPELVGPGLAVPGPAGSGLARPEPSLSTGRFLIPLPEPIRQAASERLRLAGDELSGGDDALRNGEFRYAIGRHYRAMYHAARAVIFALNQGDDHERHGVLARNLPTRMDDVHGREAELTEARLLSNQAEYDPHPPGHPAWEEQARALSVTASRFVGACEEYAFSNGML
jgi:signal peptidase